jgi:hypothetical protein
MAGLSWDEVGLGECSAGAENASPSEHFLLI